MIINIPLSAQQALTVEFETEEKYSYLSDATVYWIDQADKHVVFEGIIYSILTDFSSAVWEMANMDTVKHRRRLTSAEQIGMIGLLYHGEHLDFIADVENEVPNPRDITVQSLWLWSGNRNLTTWLYAWDDKWYIEVSPLLPEDISEDAYIELLKTYNSYGVFEVDPAEMICVQIEMDAITNTIG